MRTQSISLAEVLAENGLFSKPSPKGPFLRDVYKMPSGKSKAKPKVVLAAIEASRIWEWLREQGLTTIRSGRFKAVADAKKKPTLVIR